MDPTSELGQIWDQILDVLARIVAPDWGALVNLIPLALAPLVLLFVAAVALAWVAYGVRKPRARVRYVLGPRPAEFLPDGTALFPAGYPFDASRALVYPAGAVHGDDGAPLTVACPLCKVERSAELTTCGNCGLVLRIAATTRVAAPSGPPAGGAAAA
ncbi:MAG: hypothetical protein MUE82_10105 [Chloroflexi bacterium]|nr:hypothetical protein [Chloroflexota bacterium]